MNDLSLLQRRAGWARGLTREHSNEVPPEAATGTASLRGGGLTGSAWGGVWWEPVADARLSGELASQRPATGAVPGPAPAWSVRRSATADRHRVRTAGEPWRRRLSEDPLPCLTRWPDWAARARTEGVSSSLSIGLPVQEKVVGALNIYGRKPDAFDDDAITLAQTFAGYAAVAPANAHLFDSTATLAQQLETAMRSRAVIEQAKGIIMAERRCTSDEAFAILAKVSQDSNR
ncbi:GAF and ANTAR domain-containing protein [Plantactinospora sp. KLBMP9567]|uniref:GAF and ANTAR domain-containing protein n=1 Tax=Plantactinospora sp. KLBMP9567 TaxID=3085900 RepID=UPI0029810EE4|nr:GAF and ANTAR domain-containing protein [Plantactinospora sp. KLBMP9567]MDW5328880.1 GAF and ANTAR domain-containing protein [Plantactinospora sp. KLBMP9567]